MSSTYWSNSGSALSGDAAASDADSWRNAPRRSSMPRRNVGAAMAVWVFITLRVIASRSADAATQYMPPSISAAAIGSTPNKRSRSEFSPATASASRLGVSRIPLYQVHQPNPVVPDTVPMPALRELVAQGTIGAVGVSNYSLDRWRRADDALAARGGGPVLTRPLRWLAGFFTTAELDVPLAVDDAAATAEEHHVVDEAPADGVGRLTGRVVDGTGGPSPAAVTLVDMAGQQVARVHTEPDGTFDLRPPEAGEFVLICTPHRMGGDAARPRAVVVTVAEESVEHDVVLGAPA